MALQAIELAAGYGRRIVLENINVTAAAGVVTVLIGANGSGKSTLLRTLTGGQPPLHGRALLDGRDVSAWTVASRARHLSLV
ncbi:MAG: ABC transporter ATP-binding protein, partial [Muribaculaceae bacterium]|nr:ABC transporter ATP-binding protein [Muribaculaceae bacterium]